MPSPATTQCRGACVVVDFGTAITYDAVSSDGEYLGGIIAPGIEISIEALTSRAARLTRVDIQRAPALIGKSTEALDPVGDRARVRRPGRRHLPPAPGRVRRDLTTIATGGLARVIVGFTETIDRGR